jgi:putative ATP-binding cassette transporter
VPAHVDVRLVPQWPYMPIGTLRAAASYPEIEGTFPDEQIAEILRLVGLGRFDHRLDDDEPWEQLLSPHEQQLLALARILLQKPDWLFLDKATSALDEATERRAYELLRERLPAATIVTVAHRASVVEYHARRWTLTSAGDRVELEAA